jgi:hypothetical protein
MAKKDRNQEDIERKEPAVLPAREAMAIISATRTAAIDVQASDSGEESVASEDRDEHFESRDSPASEA